MQSSESSHTALHKPLYNSRIVDNYIKLIRKRYKYIDIKELLSYAGMEIYQVQDEGHWFTQEQINRFHEKLSILTGNKDISYEAGMYSSSPDALGVMRRYMISLMGPAKFFESLSSWTKKLTRSSTYESKKIGSNKVEITVTPNEGVQEQPFQCENRIGYMVGITRLFDTETPSFEHPKCLSRGDQYCKYIASWKDTRSTSLKKLRNYLAPVLIALSTVSLTFLQPFTVLTVILPASAVFFLSLSWACDAEANRELRSALDKLRDSSDDMSEQYNISSDNALMISEISQALGKQSDIDGIVDKVMLVLENRLDFDRILLLLANPDKTRLIPKGGFGYTDDQLKMFMKGSGFHLDRKDSKGVFVVSFHSKKSFLINDLDEIKDNLSQRSLDFAKSLGVKSFICCPICFEDESLGILAADNFNTKRPLVERDLNLLKGVAQQIGSSINNVRLMAQLRHTQKMDAIGKLAGGIAHDFNNILTAILGYSNLALYKAKLGEYENIIDHLQAVKTASFRAGDLVKQILAFSRQAEQDRKPMQLHMVIKEALGLIRASLPTTIEIKQHINENSGAVLADPSQIHQVMMNLCTNASHSMAGTGGILEVNLGDINISKNEMVSLGGLRPGSYTKITVSDTGHGMTQRTLDRIFEPYFTTKSVGKGSGIGLSVVHGIVNSHSGRITVESKINFGTTFTLLFPHASQQMIPQMQQALLFQQGNERILVVDDEELIVKLMKAMLEDLGYVVTVSTSSPEALKMFKENPSDFDLVITDLTMPVMTGIKLARELLLTRPDIPIVLCTGYGDDFTNEMAMKMGIRAYLQKPVVVSEIARTIRQILDVDDYADRPVQQMIGE